MPVTTFLHPRESCHLQWSIFKRPFLTKNSSVFIVERNPSFLVKFVALGPDILYVGRRHTGEDHAVACMSRSRHKPIVFRHKGLQVSGWGSLFVLSGAWKRGNSGYRFAFNLHVLI